MLIRTNGGQWTKAQHSEFETETEFQGLVEEVFDQVLATQSDAPGVVVREVSLPDGGRIDLLAVDTDGVITVCECKLQRNAGIRREVIGQVVEYAANLNGMPYREFRARVDARLGKGLVDAIEDLAGDEWDRDTWIDEVSDHLAEGSVRLVVAVDHIAPSLKQSVLYLNAHSDLPIFVIELQRGRSGHTEILSPTVFAEEQARRKAPRPNKGNDVENADTVIVAARNAWPEYQRTGAYICQPKRAFRDVEYLGFYAHRRIEPELPRILAFRQNVMFNAETVDALRSTGNPLDARVASIVEADLASNESNREPGTPHQVVLLDPDQGVTLSHPIRHEGRGAWVQGQRYTSSKALLSEPGTTEDLLAAGG